MTQDAYFITTGTRADLDAVIAIDDAASALYESVGIVFHFPPDHPMAVHEREAWGLCAAEGGLLFARATGDGKRAGFAILSAKDGAAYLEQISVRPAHMRRGVGRLLMTAVLDRARAAGHETIWLTTYAHVPWNRTYYERFGFAMVPEADLGPDILHTLVFQQRYLPFPADRIAMRRPI